MNRNNKISKNYEIEKQAYNNRVAMIKNKKTDNKVGNAYEAK